MMNLLRRWKKNWTLLLIAAACACQGKTDSQSIRPPASAETSSDAGGEAYVDSDGSKSDDGFVVAQTPVPISGANLALRSPNGKLASGAFTVSQVAADGTIVLTSQGLVEDDHFSFTFPPETLCVIAVGDVTALVPPIFSEGGQSLVGLVLNPISSLTVRLFKLAIEVDGAKDLVSRGIFDVAELQRLAAIIHDTEIHRGAPLADADYAAYAATFVKSNQNVIATFTAAGAPDEAVARQFSQASTTTMTQIAADFTAGHYSSWGTIEHNRIADLAARAQLAPDAEVAKILSTSVSLASIASRPLDSTARSLLNSAVVRDNLNDFVGANGHADELDSGTKAKIATAMWTVVSEATDAEIAKASTSSAAGVPQAKKLADALIASGTNAGEIAAILKDPETTSAGGGSGGGTTGGATTGGTASGTTTGGATVSVTTTSGSTTGGATSTSGSPPTTISTTTGGATSTSGSPPTTMGTTTSGVTSTTGSPPTTMGTTTSGVTSTTGSPPTTMGATTGSSTGSATTM